MIKKVLKIPLAFIQQDSLFLFQQRKKNPYKNYLGLLGGKPETGESLKKALIREVFEESSLIVQDLQFIGIVSEFFYTKNSFNKIQLHVYKATTKGKALSNIKEGNLVWIDQNEFKLFRNRFIQTDWLIVKKIMDGNFSSFEIKVFENNHNYSIIS